MNKQKGNKMSFMDFYRKKIQTARLENIKNVQKLAKSIVDKKFENLSKIEDTVVQKAKNAEERVAGLFTFVDYINDVVVNPISALQLAKDPTRQNFAEKCQPEFIAKNTKYTVKKLGNGYLCIDNGTFKKAKERKDKSSKTIDYIIETSSTVDYVCAKVTQSNGGGQDMANIDGINYAKSAMKFIDKNGKSNNRFVILLDGDNCNDFVESVNNIIPSLYKDVVFAITTDDYCK